MNLSHKVIGQGTPIVFLHGMGSSSTVWKKIVKQMRYDDKCILFDFPGHGETPFNEWDPLTPAEMASNIIKELDRLNINKFHLVGHSLGGWVGLEIASAYSDRLLSFTAIAPAGLWTHKNTYEYPSMPLLKAMHILLPIFSPIIIRSKKLKKIAFSSSAYRWNEIDNQTAKDAINSFAIACNSWYKSKKIKNFDVQAEILSKGFYKKIDPSIPITVIFGRRDMSFTRPKFQDKLLMPSSTRWLSWPDSGHVPMWDNMKMVVEEIKLNVYGPSKAV